MPREHARRTAVVVVLATAVALAGCGDPADKTSGPDLPPLTGGITTTTAAPPATPPPAPPGPATTAPATTTATAPRAEPANPADRPAAEVLATLPVAREAGGDAYERDAFGSGWLTNAAGCEVRDAVLVAESEVPATRDEGCDVSAGSWTSLYDGYSTDDPSELEIDHMVPLAEAWASGASVWDTTRRERYANDMNPRRPDALVAVTSASNQSKSDRDPAEWMPSNRDAWCRYVDAWITQKAAWELTIDQAEHDALANVLATC